jgi:hypothetical protein
MMNNNKRMIRLLKKLTKTPPRMNKEKLLNFKTKEKLQFNNNQEPKLISWINNQMELTN